MARRRTRRRSSGRRQRVIWDSLSLPQASLPSLLLTNAAGSLDGAFSAIKRYDGTDLTVRRTIGQVGGRITSLGDQADRDMELELCVGLSWFDSMADTDGQGLNTTISPGTGPLDDVDNSRWYVRCCVTIPLGTQILFGATENIVVPTNIGDSTYGGVWWVLGGTIAEFGFQCFFDTKAMRKQHGKQSEWLNIAMQAQTSSLPAVGDDITVALNSFNARHVLSVNA